MNKKWSGWWVSGADTPWAVMSTRAPAVLKSISTIVNVLTPWIFDQYIVSWHLFWVWLPWEEFWLKKRRDHMEILDDYWITVIMMMVVLITNLVNCSHTESVAVAMFQRLNLHLQNKMTASTFARVMVQGVFNPPPPSPSCRVSKHRKNCECCPVSQLIVR